MELSLQYAKLVLILFSHHGVIAHSEANDHALQLFLPLSKGVPSKDVIHVKGLHFSFIIYDYLQYR